MNTRLLAIIADEIRQDWKNVWFGAEPYLTAMETMNSINEAYGLDSGTSIVAYFLGNANTWRGPVARRVKKELNEMLKETM